jgi:ribosomal protein S18 acetylase RimI-like enzyme
MPDIRSLAGESEKWLYEAFISAFADYSVPMTMTEAEFAENNRRRGLDLDISLGAYEGDQLIGFIMNGRGFWGGKAAAYDLGTGVLPGSRGSGLSGALAAELIANLPERGIELYLLEVIRENAPAFKTYDRVGFRITRSLECPAGGYADSGTPEPAGLEIVDLPAGAAFPRAEAAALRDWEPSWQNSDDSIARMPGPLVVLGARIDGSLAGVLVASPRGTIWQLAVARGMRRRGSGSALLRELARRVGPALRYVNVQADDTECLRFLAARGLGAGVGQYEMIRELG